jgi:hypothetical protein
MRRILEAVRRLDSELTCWEDKETARPLEPSAAMTANNGCFNRRPP